MLPDVRSKGQARGTQVEAGDIETHTVKRKGNFVKENKGIFTFFVLLGLFAVRRVKDQYVVSKVRFIIFYFNWITYPLGGLFLAGKTESWVTPSEEAFMEDTMVVLALAVVPALQAYSLKFMTKSLPEVLENISELSVMEVGFETPLKLCMKAGKVSISPGSKPLHPERLFNWLPRAMVFFSMVIFLTVSSTEYFMEVNFQTLDKELPILVILFVCLTFPFASSLFVVVFIKWLGMVYKALYRHCREVIPGCKLDQVLAICSYVDRLQKIFSLLDNGFFRYIISINATSIIVGASLCMARLTQDYSQIVYLGPLTFYGFTLALVCEAGERLAGQVSYLVSCTRKM